MSGSSLTFQHSNIPTFQHSNILDHSHGSFTTSDFVVFVGMLDPALFIDIQHYLNTLALQALADLVLDLAQRHDRLYQSLLINPDRSAGGTNLFGTPQNH